MAIWNEIKRSINSNLSNPLNELIGQSNDNTTVMDKLDILINNSGNSNGNVQYVEPRENAIKYNNLQYDFCGGDIVVYNDEIHILGSSASSSYYKYHYKWNGSSWSSVSTLPYSFYNGASVVYNDEIHILGGNGGNTYHYKWNGSSWSSISTLPYSLYIGCAVVYNNQIHILGSNIVGYRTYHCSISMSIHLLIHQPSIISIPENSNTLNINNGNNNSTLTGIIENGITTFNITDPGLYNIPSKLPITIRPQQ